MAGELASVGLQLRACDLPIRLSQPAGGTLQVQDLHTSSDAAALPGRRKAIGSGKLRQCHSPAQRPLPPLPGSWRTAASACKSCLCDAAA